MKVLFATALFALFGVTTNAFAPARLVVSTRSHGAADASNNSALCAAADGDAPSDDVLAAAINAMYGSGHEMREEPAVTQARIQDLVDQHAVLLFIKGSKFFPQCGFSDTATKILETFEIDYETVNVLEDDTIREGVKVFSQWPTIPQLYVNGEFIGGSDIMLEMYESGELKKLIDEIPKKL